MPRPVRRGRLAVAMMAATSSAVSGSAWPLAPARRLSVDALQNAVRWRELQAPAALPAADWRSTVVRLPAEALAAVHDLLRHPPPRPPGAAWPAVTWPA